jgi:hypothetical protein
MKVLHCHGFHFPRPLTPVWQPGPGNARDEGLPVQADAEQRFRRVAVLVLHALEAGLDLLDDFFAARGVEGWAEFGGGGARILVFDDDPRIDRIGAALRNGNFVLSFQFDPGFPFDKGQLSFHLDADFFFLAGKKGGVADLLGKLLGFPGDQLVEGLVRGHGGASWFLGSIYSF